jgi:broad specificity phosphatase PhoE
MTKVYLVRHGPTHAKTLVGWSDLPADLSDTAALARLDAYLPSDAVIISSDLSRAKATADAIQGERRRLPHDPDLREINFGDWELQRFDEIKDQEHLRASWETPGEISPPNGESWNDIRARVNTVVDRLVTRQVEANSGADIVIVAHFGVILTQVQRAAGITAYQAFGHKIDNLSVTDVQITQTGWRVGDINHNP